MSEWTVDTLKEYFEKVLDEKEKRYDQRFLGQEEAIKMATISNEKRFEGVNYLSSHKELSGDIKSISSRIDKKDGEKVGGVDVRGWLFGGIMLLVEILTLAYIFLNHL